MKLRLIRAARIQHQAGEIVEVSPTEAGFLLSTKSAERVPEEMDRTAEPLGAEEPEVQKPENPEEKTAKRTTRTKK